ncbi:MAG: hypothetical protein QXR58_00850 [Candidatus Micrarchaeaceae archaeon]
MTSSEVLKDAVSFSYESSAKTTGIVERALRDVAEDNWKTKISDPKIIEELARHMSSMEKIIPGFRYEYIYSDRLISSIKHMEASSTIKFVRNLESIAYFYSKFFEVETASLVVLGLLSKTHGYSSAEQHRRIILRKLSAKAELYKKRISYYESRFDSMYAELRKTQSGIFRFLKRSRATRVSAEIKAISPRYKAAEAGFRRISKMIEKMGGGKSTLDAPV